jgi:hypothetical protein
VSTAHNRAQRRTVSLLLGTATVATFAFVATLFQTPGLEAPVEVARVAVITTMLATVALPLVWLGDPLGYPVAVLSGAAAAVGTGLAIAGAFGPTRLAPAAFAFVALGVLLVVSSVVAWRDGAVSPRGTSRSNRDGTDPR